MSVSIRPAGEADLPAVRDLLVRTWHDTYDAIYGAEKVTEITERWHSVANLRRQIGLPLSLFLVAEAGGRLVGTAKATGSAGGEVMLDRLYVDPGAQRSGAGAALLAATLDAFPTGTAMVLEVEPANAKAVSFYRKHGFERDGATPNCGGSSGVAADRMRRRLPHGTAGTTALLLRTVEDRDAQDLIGLITLCFAEYRGCFFDPHDDMPDIVRPADSRLAREGVFLVMEDERGRVGACVAVDFPSPGTAELHRLYVRPDLRGRGLGPLLTGRMENVARRAGALRMILWSDMRFTTAHRVYERLGYMRASLTRAIGDISGTREFSFSRVL